MSKTNDHIREGERVDLSRSSNFHKTDNVDRMKERCDDLDALFVRCGDCGRNEPSKPHTGRHMDRNRRLPLIGRLTVSSYIIPADTHLFLLAAGILLYRQA